MYVSAIIAAGGRGMRVGADRPKQLLEIGGRSLLARSVDAFTRNVYVNEIVIVLPSELLSVVDGLTSKPARVVAGGARRQDSVAHGFAAIDARADLVVVHDAARPFVSDALINRTIEAGWEFGAAIAALRASDTVKQAADGFVGRTLPRDEVYLAQTPQAFRRDILAQALALAADGIIATDEAVLAERAGYRVRLVDGEPTNIKITTPEDLRLAAAVPLNGRIGTGYDLHRLVDGRPLVLGGVTIPSERGALGHSDADVVCHAVTDAVLGAACRGDIGRHFPDSDERWRGASSIDLLRRAVALVGADGFVVENADVTVVLETPRIRDHLEAMRAAVAAALGVDAGRVSIKGKTNEGVDAVGRGEAIAAHAVVLLTGAKTPDHDRGARG